MKSQRRSLWSCSDTVGDKLAKIKKPPQLDPSKLPGSYKTRMFVGGSYRASAIPQQALPVAGKAKATKKIAATPRQMLDHIRDIVVMENFDPVLAAEFRVGDPDREIHHDALFLLHACRLAIFDLSEFSGALMEAERAADYGTLCLILYEDPAGSGWRVSRMLNSFVEEHIDRFQLHGYIGPDDAKNRVRNWLREMKRRKYV